MEVNVVQKDDRRKIDKILVNFEDCNFEDYIGLISSINPVETQRGIYNEYGTANAPARPFIEPTYLKNEKYLIQQVLKNLKKFESPKVFISKLSGEMVEKIRYKIDIMKYPKLAPSTVARKGHDKLLKDTYEMYNAIKTVRRVITK